MASNSTVPRPLLAYAAVVVLNYAAQIPYALDLYGLHVSVPGTLLLGATLVWFLVALGGFARSRPWGLALLTAYAATQAAFYFRNLVLLTANGFGFLYNLAHARDGIVFWVFVIGDVNFVAACLALAYLGANWRSLSTSRRQAEPGGGDER